MARKSPKRPAARAGKKRDYQPRDVLLAGLGAVSIGRKQVAAAYAQAPERVAELRAAAGAAVRKAGKSVSGKVVALRKQAAPVQAAIEALARDARRQIEAGLAPALARLGVKTPPARRAPRRAAKPAARRRKAA
jgi:hypothetical protein